MSYLDFLFDPSQQAAVSNAAQALQFDFTQVQLNENLFDYNGACANSFNIKKDEDGKYIASVLSEKNDDELSRDLNALCKKYHISDFADLSVKRRRGGVADVKTSEQEII